MEYNWILKPQASAEEAAQVQTALGISPVLANLLAQRGITDFEGAKAFFRPDLRQLHNPYLMQDMDKAVERILKAMKLGERILIYGDYDVDGTTSVALMYDYLKDTYPHLVTYIPDRYKEGYGVSYAGIDFAHDNEITLIIALDCGVKAIAQVAYANERGIDFIICDHHTPGDALPSAVAVLDPKRTDCSYPYKELSGCGVGFKLIQALHERMGGDFQTLIPLLDLLAVSIGSDIVPIAGENRVLAYFGMQVFNGRQRQAFYQMALQVNKPVFTITDVVFIIGPRINAAGRMEHGRIAVELLTAKDPQAVAALVERINSLNQTRKDLDKNITAAALEQLREEGIEKTAASVVYDPQWSKGVIGIVASRLIENYYKPTIVFTKSGEKLAGSARSVQGFDVYEALDACSDVLEQFGGHKYAAGMTLKPENYTAFKAKFQAVVAATILPEQKVPALEVDAVATLEDFTAKFYRVLQQFGPFGPENMDPLFCVQNLVDTGKSRVVGADKSHLKLDVKNVATGYSIGGIGFKMAEKYALLEKGPVDVIGHLDVNVFRGETTFQLRVLDIKSSAPENLIIKQNQKLTTAI